MKKRKFRVLIVDEHLQWRKTLRLFFSAYPNVKVVEMFNDEECSAARYQQARPDLVIWEVSQAGLQIARELSKNNPGLQLIGVTADMSPRLPALAPNDGITTIIPKNLLADYLSPKRLHRMYK